MRKNIFDSPLYHIMVTFSNVVIASMLWVFTSIPLLTMGASTAALYYTVVKVIRRSTGSLYKEYFHAFRGNFKQSLIPSLIFALYGLVMAADTYNFFRDEAYYTIPLGGWLLVLLLLIILQAYLYPVMSRFQNTFPALLRLSVEMAVKNIKTTVLLLLLVVAGIVGTWAYLPAGIIVPGAVVYFASFLLEPVLKKYMPEVKSESKEASQWYNQ